MFNFINNFLTNKNNFQDIKSEFKNLKKNLNIQKIFNCIDSYSTDAEIRYVGGCVRKILNREKIDDIDLATTLKPNEVIEVLKKNNINYYETGIEHGTITAIIEGEKYEITSLRSDIVTDGRYAKVEFTKDWIKDAERRDFTINSIYSDINGNLFDPFEGIQDLKNGKVVFVGNAEKRIKEDYLRILRYIRFFLMYSKVIHDPKVIKAINKNLVGVSKISSNRLLDEFQKIFKTKNIEKIYQDKFCLETIKLLFPQFKGINYLENINQFSSKISSEIDFYFLLSLLTIDESDNAEYFIYKFNLSNKAKKRILNIKKFYFNKTNKNQINIKNLWKILYYYGREALDDILNYKIYTSRRIDKNIRNYVEYFKNKEIPKLPITGDDLMQKFNIKEGKKIGENLKLIENFWLNNEFKITEDQINKLIKN
tara:strand:- start:1020 stop:2294 length:1275 start_codon:yes stop_codon:yes gene_type:complete